MMSNELPEFINNHEQLIKLWGFHGLCLLYHDYEIKILL